MRIAMAQMKNCGSREGNLKKSLELLRQAAEQGADLILYPEVQLSEFFAQYPGRDVSGYGVALESETVKAFQTACRENRIMAAPNVYLREDGHLYDASLLIDAEGKILGVQKMVHIAQAEQFYEQDYYTPSDDGFHVFDTPFGRMGLVICFDRHYPESIRTEALMGADLILIPTANVKAEPSEMFEWELRVQAFQNSVAIAMCNRVGTEDAMDFSGESIAVGAAGERLVKGDDQEGLVFAQIDLSRSAALRAGRPYTNLRRSAFYR